MLFAGWVREINPTDLENVLIWRARSTRFSTAIYLTDFLTRPLCIIVVSAGSVTCLLCTAAINICTYPASRCIPKKLEEEEEEGFIVFSQASVKCCFSDDGLNFKERV